MGGALPASDLVIVVVPALIVCVALGWRRVSRLQLLVRCVLIVYLGGLVGVALFPLPVVPSEIRLQRQLIHGSAGTASILYNAVPGKGVLNDLRTAKEAHGWGVSWYRALMPLWGNLLLLAPLGYLLPLVSSRWRSLRRLAFAVFLAAAGLELIQLVGTLAYGFPYRRIDIDTVWISFVGGMIGYGLSVVMKPHLERLGLDAARLPEPTATE